MTDQKKFLPTSSSKIPKWHVPSDPKQVLPRILAAYGRRKFISRVLGTLPSGDDILFFQRPAPPGKPVVLIVAGFHGEELGGPLGILRLLEMAPDIWLDGIGVSIIPILNPTGHRIGQRRNQWGENPNDGFCHPDIDPSQPSKEGRILLNNLPFLKQCSKDAFISLHEDGFQTGHIYGYGVRPQGAADALLAEMRPFGITPNHRISENGAELRSGLSLNHHDGSFEDRLHHEGVPLCLVTETPRTANLEIRAEVNDRMIRALLLYLGLQRAVPAPIVSRPSTLHGLGAFAIRDIRIGEAIGRFGGRILNSSKVPVFPEEDMFLQIGPETYLGAAGDVLDQANHSCDPNAGVLVGGGLVALVAIRNIATGEEILWDYSTSVDGSTDLWEMDCRCGSKGCRGRVGAFQRLPDAIRTKYTVARIVPDWLLGRP
jgi:hypothetical protein